MDALNLRQIIKDWMEPKFPARYTIGTAASSYDIYDRETRSSFARIREDSVYFIGFADLDEGLYVLRAADPEFFSKFERYLIARIEGIHRDKRLWATPLNFTN
jgi:hypothetical protein